ncbi:unnamed protein product [Aphanomyces euteiches]
MTSAPPLVPLPVLFGNAEYAMPQISPDGTQIAFLTAASNGVMNIFLQPVGAKSAEPVQVTTEDNRPIRFFRWAVTGTHLLYVQDMNGNERFHLYVVDLTTMTTVNRTPFESAKVLTTFPMTSWYNYINRLTSVRCPNEVVIGLNTRIPTLFDVHRVNILTGETTLVATNPGKVDAWIVDSNLIVRAMVQMEPGDVWSKSLSVRATDSDPWKVIATWGLDDSVEPLNLTSDGSGLYVKSTLAHGSGHACPNKTLRLVLLSTVDGSELSSVAYDPKSDVDHVEFNPISGEVDFATFEHYGHRKQILSAAVQADIDVLASLRDGTTVVSIESRAANDDKAWTVAIASDHHSKEYYYYDRTTKEATLLALERPALKDFSFSPMKPVEIPCRDGETMVGYLTLPRGAPATTGSECPRVNYRGSDGYGMRWLNLGNGEWGRRMQDDLTDAVEWAVQSGVVDKSRVAIYGRSYGGYAAFAGLAFTPDVYACGVDVVGPSNIKTLLAATPPNWDHMRKVFAVRIGNVLEDDAVNMRMSPLFHVDKVKRPLLIGQGANDPRVAQSESDQIAR